MQLRIQRGCVLITAVYWVPKFMKITGLPTSHTYPNITSPSSSQCFKARMKQLLALATVSIVGGVLNIYIINVYHFSVGKHLKEFEKKVSDSSMNS